MAEKSTEVGYEEATDEYFGNLIRAFRSFLLDNLRCSHIICFLHIQEVSKIAASIHVKEAQGLYHEAVDDLLKAIEKANEPGKWRMLIDALRIMEDSAILDVLLEEQKVKEREWLTNECISLIEVFKEDIVEYLHLEQLLPMMVEKGLILKEDMTRLNAWMDSGNRRMANISFLLIVHRHKSDWYDIFISILSRDEHHRELLKMIMGEEKYKMKIIKKDTEMLQLSTEPPDAEQTQDMSTQEENKSIHGERPVNMVQQDLTQDSPLALKSPRKLLPMDDLDDEQGTVPASSDCGCSCCKQVMLVLEAMRQDLTFMREKISSLETEVSQMRAELKKEITL